MLSVKVPNIRNKLIYYIIHFIFCQERATNMDDDILSALKEMLIELVNQCNDLDVLDMIYKLLPLIT